MTLTDAESSTPRATLLSEHYCAALGEFAYHGHEERLARAYDLARVALRDGVSLAELSGIHQAAVSRILSNLPEEEEGRCRSEQFFLEVIAVYDMALQGYRNTVERLRQEVAERRRVEGELQRQRDRLDREVRERTRALTEKAAALEAANRKLTEINREQAEFTYAISHDLKSPTNTIGMLLSELAVGSGARLPPEEAELVDLSLQTVARMGQLVEDILGYSRTIEGHLVPQTVDLGRLVAEVVEDLQGDIVAAGATVDLGDLHTVAGDPMQLRLLFQNLIGNAVKFHSPDRPPKVTVRCTHCSGHTLRIAVADNGIGIAQEFHRKIFGMFQRLHPHDAYPGSGLGLTLCRRIVSNHSGKIALRSAPGAGTTFEVTLRRPR